MKLGAIMNRYPQTVASNDPLSRARNLMVWGGLRSLPVIDMQNGRLVGLLTDADIARHQSECGEGIRSSSTDTVAMAMSRRVLTAGPEDSVTESGALMAFEKVGSLPITEQGRLIGLVMASDVLTAQVRGEMEPGKHSRKAVAEVMVVDPPRVDPGDSLLDAAVRMRAHGICHLPVTDRKQQVVGMLSDREVRATIGDPSRVFADDLGLDVNRMRVADAMSTPPVTTRENQSCTVAARAFVELNASAVAVVDRCEVLVGVVCYLDILRAFSE